MNIIIIGAGAAGLMAAKELSAAGHHITILEARDRIGGRIFTVQNNNDYYESGAEFIHGKLPVTLALLKEAGLGKRKQAGETMQFTKGKWQEDNDFFDNSDLITKRLKELTEDMNIAAFLTKYFSGKKYEKLRQSLTGYIEGYYAAEPEKCSAQSFLEEFESEDEEQYRPIGGYLPLLQYLLNECLKAGGGLHLNTVVKEIRWSKHAVEIIAGNNQIYKADKVIVTVPLGIWTARSNAKGAIKYTPSLPQKVKAAKQMGFGAVIKILLCFDEVLLANEAINQQADADISNISFVLTDQPIPTWWTQLPQQSKLLTGWLAGPPAAILKDESDEAIFEMALQSLSKILKQKTALLKAKLLWWKVHNWTANPFTRGAYSYSTMQTKQARKVVAKPVEDTLFFAGEALYEGPEMGTVEAALISGKSSSKMLVASSKTGT